MHNIHPFLTPHLSAELGFLLMGFLSKAEIPLPAPHLTCAYLGLHSPDSPTINTAVEKTCPPS